MYPKIDVGPVRDLASRGTALYGRRSIQIFFPLFGPRANAAPLLPSKLHLHHHHCCLYCRQTFGNVS